MANSIALAQNYLAVLDGVYKADSKTAIMDAANSEIQFIGANTAKIFKLSSDGFGDYSRNTGYPIGSVTGTWETLTLGKDRAVELNVDRFDDEETRDLAFGRLLGEFVRVSMNPEIDAYRIAKWATNAGTSANADITVGTTNVADLIDAGFQAMQEGEVPDEGSVIYISPKAYNGLKNKITRYLANENEVNRTIEMYDGHQVIVVPPARMNTAVTLYDGSSNFGFVPTAGGYAINFMIVHPTAVKNAIKFALPKVFTPDENQIQDAYKLQVRCYHDTFVLDNKTKGIYLHRAATANS